MEQEQLQHTVLIEENYGSHIDGRHILVTATFFVSADIGRSYSFGGQMFNQTRTYLWGTCTETCNCQLSGFEHVEACS